MNDILSKMGVNVNVTFHLIFFALLWVRVLGMTIVIPFLFGKPVPRSVTVGAAAVIAFFLHPNLVPETPPDLGNDLLFLFMLFLKEAFYGFVLGFVVGIIFYGFQAAGSMIDNQRGMSIARAILPQLGTQTEISGIFLFQFAIVVYISFGGHLVFLKSFVDSYSALPVLEFPKVAAGIFPLVDLLTKITGEVLYISIQIAAPVIIAIFLSDIILGVANRIAPQIDVWMLGFNLKGYVGILLLFVSIAIIGKQVLYYSQKSDVFVDASVSYLQGKEPEILPYPEERRGEEMKEVPEVITK